MEDFTKYKLPRELEEVKFTASKEEYENFFNSRVWLDIKQQCLVARSYQLAVLVNRETSTDLANFLRGSIEQLSIVLDWPITLVKENQNV